MATHSSILAWRIPIDRGSGGLRPLVELCVEPAGLGGRCTGVAVPLRVVPSHSSILAWEIPWTEEPGGLQSMGSQVLDTA